MDVLQRKIEYIKQTGADTLVTTNPGCMLQIEYGLREAGLPIKVMHLAQLLDEAYGA
jgi:glycolate oxidase iron-sulfur subunit